MDSIGARWASVAGRIEQACRRAGRDPASVRVVAVSKTHGPEMVRAACDCGLTLFGENRVQEAQAKMPLCPARAVWHLVGHLQTNKARAAARLFEMIHSVDSLKLLAALDEAAGLAGRTLPVCLEVNVAGEATKFGLAPDMVIPLLRAAERMRRVEIAGLMCIPPPAPDPEAVRPYFRRLRELRDAARVAAGFALPELSMGMSQDFEAAVEEGATLVRLGTVLFGRREAVWKRPPDDSAGASAGA